MELISTIFGVMGLMVTVMLYQQKKRDSLLVYKLIADVVWIGHYAFIGAFSGVAVCIIAACRELIFVKRDKDNRNGIVWLPIFIVVAILSTVFTWNSFYSIFAGLASCIAVISFFIAKPKLSRIFVFPISLCMLIYDAACGSVMGIINECVAISSSIVGLILHDRKRKNQESAIN